LATFALLIFSVVSFACSESPPEPEEVIQGAQALEAPASEQGFAVYGRNSIAIGQSSRIHGSIAVSSKGKGPRLTAGYEIAVGAHARLAQPGELFGDTILLAPAVVAGAIHAQELSAIGAEHGPISPFEGVPDLLSVIAPIAGAQPLTIAANTGPLSAGSYSDVRVQNDATLKLAGGVYEFASLTLGTHGRLEALAPTRVLVAGKLATAESAYLGPSAEGEPVALNLTIDVAGRNGETGSLGETPRVVCARSDGCDKLGASRSVFVCRQHTPADRHRRTAVRCFALRPIRGRTVRCDQDRRAAR
jgi:hypothetical protein